MSATRDDSLPNPTKWLVIGAIGLIVSIIGFFVDTRAAAFCYLAGLIFTTSITIGMLFLVMIHHIFDAYWSTIIRRQAENFLAALPYMAILFIPLFLLMGQFATLSGMSAGLFKAAESWLGHRKGGVAMSAIGACAGFGRAWSP